MVNGRVREFSFGKFCCIIVHILLALLVVLADFARLNFATEMV
jgi:hypothetical protein